MCSRSAGASFRVGRVTARAPGARASPVRAARDSPTRRSPSIRAQMHCKPFSHALRGCERLPWPWVVFGLHFEEGLIRYTEHSRKPKYCLRRPLSASLPPCGPPRARSQFPFFRRLSRAFPSHLHAQVEVLGALGDLGAISVRPQRTRVACCCCCCCACCACCCCIFSKASVLSSAHRRWTRVSRAWRLLMRVRCCCCTRPTWLGLG